MNLYLLAQRNSGGGEAAAGVGIVVLLVELAIIILMIASAWVIFTKAGKPGWAAIIPIYNYIVLLEIVNRPIWWIILMFIPCVNFVIIFILCMDLAKSFGKETGYGLGLFFLGFIFGPMLAFGSAQYRSIPR